MKYSVIGPDGSRYGPVDIQTLNQWVGEGRILPQTLLEGEDGAQLPASAVNGLTFPSAQPTPGPYAQSAPTEPGSPSGGQYASYPRQPMYGPGEVPPELQVGFNWGAFFLTWIWGLNHKAYLTLISLGLSIVGTGINFAMRPAVTPGASPMAAGAAGGGAISWVFNIAQLGLMVWFGLMGNRWAWQSGRFSTVEQCKRTQAVWGWWGLGICVVCCGCVAAATVMAGMAVANAMR